MAEAALQWGRKISIRIPSVDLTIEGPPFYLGVQLRRELSQTPPSGGVSIEGLSETTRNRIAGAKGQRIEIHAGYESLGNVARVFAGTIANVYPRATLPGWSTEIEVTSFSAGDDVRRAISVRSYGGTVTVRQIVQDIASDMGLDVDVEDLPGDVKVPKFAWAGDAASGLAEALRGQRIPVFNESTGTTRRRVVGRVAGTWYEDDGVIRFDVPGIPALRALEWEVGVSTGMIGAPFITDRGVDVSMFLTPGIRMADVLVLPGTGASPIAGRFKVLSLRYSLSSHADRAFAQQMAGERL